MNAARTRTPRSSNPRLPELPARSRSDAQDRLCALLSGLAASLGDAFALSERERDIAYHLLFGCNTYAIAQRLDLDERAVLVEIQMLLTKTGTDGRETLLPLSLRLATVRDHADVPVIQGATPRGIPGP